MFGDFSKTWKWSVPGFLFFVLIWVAMVIFPMGWKDATVLVVIVALFCFIVAATKYWEINSAIAVENYRRRKEADAITPRGMMLESGKGVHPETIRLILGEQARRWGLVSGTQSPTGKPYKFLGARPRVTEEFFVYFLRKSIRDRGQYMAKQGNLSDNDRSWDPRKITTAYEMYDDVESLLIEEMKATRPFGPTKPGYWLGDWDAHSVGLDYGIDIDEWEDGVKEKVESGASTASGVRREVPDVIAKAMEGLEKTQAMKAKFERLKQ